MAKKRPEVPPEDSGEPPRARRYTVEIDEDLVKKIRFLAANDNLLPPSWINNQLRRIIREEWPRIVQEIQTED